MKTREGAQYKANSELLDIQATARIYGGTPAAWRARIARKQIPYRRLGGRILIVRRELDQLIADLPGVHLAEIRRSAKDGL